MSSNKLDNEQITDNSFCSTNTLIFQRLGSAGRWRFPRRSGCLGRSTNNSNKDRMLRKARVAYFSAGLLPSILLIGLTVC